MKKVEKSIRQLTVSGLFVEGNWRTKRKPKHVPFIRICGQWLEECGFAEGQKVRVRVETGRLVVEVEEGTPSN